MATTELLPEVEEEITEFDGKAHIVRIKSLMRGGPVVALCGKKWIPSTIADALKYPVCGKCKELLDFLEMMDNV